MTRMIEVSEDALNTLKVMAEQDAKDAARYRLLREHEAASILNLICDGWNFFGDAGDQLDSVVDSAMQTE